MTHENPVEQLARSSHLADRLAGRALDLFLRFRPDYQGAEEFVNQPTIDSSEAQLLSIAELTSRQLVVRTESTDILGLSIDQISRRSAGREQLEELTRAITAPYEQLFISEAKERPKAKVGLGRWQYDHVDNRGILRSTVTFEYSKDRRGKVAVPSAEVEIASQFDDKSSTPVLKVDMADNTIGKVRLTWRSQTPTILLAHLDQTYLGTFIRQVMPVSHEPCPGYVWSLSMTLTGKSPTIKVVAAADAGENHYWPIESATAYNPDSNEFIRHMHNPSYHKQLKIDGLQKMPVGNFGQVLKDMLNLIPNTDLGEPLA